MDLIVLISSVIGIVLIIVGFAGCIIPGLPGPPFAFLSLVLLKLSESSMFTTNFLITFALITTGVYFLDYLLPLFGAKMFNASKQGIWFSIIGMLIGIFFFPPFGMILGLLLGAITGELIAGKAHQEAVKIGIVSFVFSLIAIVIKIVLTGVMTFYFFEAVVKYYV